MDIGIDLGTTFSVIAVDGRVELAADYPPGIYLDECDVTIIPTPDGEQTFPSVMWEDPENPGSYRFGTEAAQKAEEGMAPVMFSKRKIGTREEIPLNGRVVVARDVAREFLRHLKACAEQALGHEVSRAVITHPAYFDRGAVEETRQAAAEAGFDVSRPEQMLMEPVAAALAYTRTDDRDPLRVLTYDLGGGTFDVTYLERNCGVIEMKAFDGDHLLGGYNLDREIVHWVRKRLEAQGRQVVLDEGNPEDRGRLARMLRLAERTKLALAAAKTPSLPVDFRARDVLVDTEGRPIQINERITREQFTEMIRPLIDSTIEACKRALTKAGAGEGDLDEVLLVGGSTYGPWIPEAVGAEFPSASVRLFHPDLCVGAGAAIHASMVLPPVVRDQTYKLTLEAPETSTIWVINVSGQVLDSDGGPAGGSVEARLRLPNGDVVGPQPLTAEGRFLFEDVELMEDEPSRFTLVVEGPRGSLEHRFEVLYEPLSAQVSGVTTVLPRPLYIQTLDGLVPLAEEGVPLPSRREESFMRENDNPNISLRLFQAHDPIGEIRIEGIPPEAGRGSFIDLVVEVTDKNRVQGKARVRTKQGQVVAEADVLVHFDVPDVPSVEEMRRDFQELESQWSLMVLELEGELDEQTKSQAPALIRSISKLFEQQPIERQEIHVALRRFRTLLNPPEDEMNPTRKQFAATVQQCRETIDGAASSAKQAIDEAERGEQEKGAAEASARTLRKVDHYLPVLDQLEQEGLSAHDRRDRRSWSRVYDAVTGIQAQFQETRGAGSLPTFLNKILAGGEAMRLIGRLDHEAANLEQSGRLADWLPEVQRIRAMLDAALQAIAEVDDDLPADQGRGQISVIYQRMIHPAEEAMDRLGMDVSKIRSSS